MNRFTIAKLAWLGTACCFATLTPATTREATAQETGAQQAATNTPEQRFFDWTDLKHEAAVYSERRDRMMSLLAEDGADFHIVPGAEGRSHGTTFRQTDDFLYFTGLELPHSILVLDVRASKALVYTPRRDVRFESAARANDFPGRPLADDPELASRSGLDIVLPYEEFDSALTHYQRTLEICDKSNDRMSILSVMAKMVDANKGLEKYDVAVTLCLEILDHYQDNRDPQGTVDTLEGMADIYISKGEKLKAADAYRTISSIHKNFKHDNIAAKFIEKAETLES